MQKLNLDKPAVVFFVLVFFLALEIIILFPWAISKISDLGKNITRVKISLTAIKKDWPNKDDYLKKEEKLKDAVSRQHASFIPVQQESKLLSFISKSSKNFEVEVESIIPGEPEDYSLDKKGKLKYLPINIKMKSNFHNLAVFLDYLQNSQYFFEVKEVKILAGDKYNSINMLICGLIEQE